MDFLNGILVILQSLGGRILALIALIALDVILGVARSIKYKVFDWRDIADFYLSMVVPLLLGWIGFAVVAQLASASVLGEYAFLVDAGVVNMAYLAVIAKIASSIVSNVKYIYGKWLPFPEPDDDINPPMTVGENDSELE